MCSSDLGVRTLEQDAAEAGDNWVEIRDQVQAEADDLLTRAKALSEKHDIPLPMAIELLSQRSPNPVSLTGSNTQPEPDEPAPEPAKEEA